MKKNKKKKETNILRIFITSSILIGIILIIFSFIIIFKSAQKVNTIKQILYKNDGLVAVNDIGNIIRTKENIYEYRYIGINPNNYIKYDDELYRIISIIEKDNKLEYKIIKETYNIIKLDNQELLNSNLYKELNNGNGELKSYNIGKIELNLDKMMLKATEAFKSVKMKKSLINASDIIYSTIEPLYNATLENKEIIENSWLNNYNTIIQDIRYQIKDSKIEKTLLDEELKYHEVIKIEKENIINGKGTIEEPYY